MSINPYRGERIGNLRERVSLQQRIEVGRNGFNEPIFDWSTIARVAARVEPFKGAERYEEMAGQRYSEEILNVFVRYRADVSSVWRVLWERTPGQSARILEIVAVSNPDERRRFLKLQCKNFDGDEA